MNTSKLKSFVSLFVVAILALVPVGLAVGQQGVGGPGGGTGGTGGGTGGGGGTGNQEGHYVFTELHETDGTIPGSYYSYFNNMCPTKKITTTTSEITFTFEVADKANKIKLDVNETIEVDFTATLNAKDQSTPYPGYLLSYNGFTLLPGSTGTTGQFTSVGQTLSGSAEFEYLGPNSTGKHHFLLDISGVAVGGGHLKEVWCSHDSPEPITQCEGVCRGGCGLDGSSLPASADT